MKKNIFKNNYDILLPIIILCIMSLVNMYGASFVSSIYKMALVRQSIFIAIGLVVMYIVYKINNKFFINNSFYFYLFGIVILILVLFFGQRINGASSWFKVGPISIQPSEIFKYFYLVYISKLIATNKKFIKVIAVGIIPIILIFLEPDTGVAIMYFIMLFGMFIASKNKKKVIYLSSVICFSAIILGIIYFYKKDLFINVFGTSIFYRLDRILSFKNNTSYQLNNALIGIGSSYLLGHGLTSTKIYIPELTTDFAYDLNICNFGIVGGVFITIIYVYLIYKIYMIYKKQTKIYNKCMVLGIFLLFTFQVIEHIFMNIGYTPITGITLPFLSYGGSSLISYFMLFGFLLKKNKNA